MTQTKVILWVGPECAESAELARGYGIVFLSPDACSLPPGPWRLVIAWKCWPADLPLPDAPLIVCAENAAVAPEVLRRAAVVLHQPVRTPSLVREIEALLGYEWSLTLASGSPKGGRR